MAAIYIMATVINMAMITRRLRAVKLRSPLDAVWCQGVMAPIRELTLGDSKLLRSCRKESGGTVQHLLKLFLRGILAVERNRP